MDKISYEDNFNNNKIDRPIKSLENDELNRMNFVTNLASALINQTTSRSTGAVIGLCGEWGSGKSSILNLLEEDLTRKYRENMILVRFEPWLISTRDALIANFISELVLSIEKSNINIKIKNKVITSISEYDSLINAGVDTLTAFLQIPFIGSVLKAIIRFFKKKSKTLHDTKSDVENELLKINLPIVVMIDEVDRLEDQEVIEIMRLVKAVVDFSNISYLIAYDVNRVIEALGSNYKHAESRERGREYLEKIIQFQIQIPALFEDELIHMLGLRLRSIMDFQNFEHRLENSRYVEFVNAAFPRLLKTPRDLIRVIGTFKALYNMMSSEINWIDLLAYSVLLTKAPNIAEKIRNDPIFFSDDFDNVITSRIRTGKGQEIVKAEDQLQDKLGYSWNKSPESLLIKFLFPRFGQSGSYYVKDEDHSQIKHYRSLCFLVKQGTPPGLLSIIEVKKMFELPENVLFTRLDNLVEKETFNDLTYILSIFYEKFRKSDQVNFWNCLIKWHIDKLDSNSFHMSQKNDLIDKISKSFIDGFSTIDLPNPYLDIIKFAIDIGANDFVAEVFRNQILSHELFGNNTNHRNKKIGSKEKWESIIENVCKDWKFKHINSDWFFRSYTCTPTHILRRLKYWDQECKERVIKLIQNKLLFDKFLIMTFGQNYVTEKDTIESIMGWDIFLAHFQSMDVNRKMSDDLSLACDRIKNEYGGFA